MIKHLVQLFGLRNSDQTSTSKRFIGITAQRDRGHMWFCLFETRAWLNGHEPREHLWRLRRNLCEIDGAVLVGMEWQCHVH
jgi:hypothetical protein